MAEGSQPPQPAQLGPGAAARGMKRESELELPAPGGGGDGAEPGLSKRPRTEEAAADGGGMQVSARGGRPVTAGPGARRRAGVGGLGSAAGGRRPGPGSEVERAPARRRGVPARAHAGTRRGDRFRGAKGTWARRIAWLPSLSREGPGLQPTEPPDRAEATGTPAGSLPRRNPAWQRGTHTGWGSGGACNAEE